MFSKKHYEAIASVLKANRPRKLNPHGTQKDQWERQAFYVMHQLIVGQLADMLANDNPQFDRERFVKATE